MSMPAARCQPISLFRTLRSRPRFGDHAERLSPAEWALCAALAVAAAAAVWAPPVAPHTGYHAFADARGWGHLPFAADVLSNLAFAIVGALGLRSLARSAGLALAHAAAQVAASLVLCLGLLFTAVVSGVYHLHPDDAGLALDRMGMAWVFTGVMGVAVANRVSDRAAWTAMALLAVLAPAAAAVAWVANNAMPWAVVQFGGLFVLAGLAALPARQGQTALPLVALLVGYAVAKVAEMSDQWVFDLTAGLVSGHTLKHVLAACAVWPVLTALVYRDALPAVPVTTA